MAVNRIEVEKTASHSKSKKQARKHRVSICLNDSELNVVQRYCAKYGVRNRSKLIRETLVKAVLKQLDNDSPTLFD